MSDISNFVRRKPKNNHDEINKILGLINPLAFADPEDTGLKERIILGTPKRRRSTTVDTGGPTELSENTRERFSSFFNRVKPDPVDAYSLSDSVTGSGFTFANDGPYGSGVTTDGSTYIVITDDTILNPTDELTIAMNLKLAANSSKKVILGKGTNQYQLEYGNTANLLRFSVSVNSTVVELEYTYTPDTWFSVVMRAQSGNQQLYIDGSSQDTDTQTGTLDTNSNNLGIYALYDGTLNMANGDSIGLFTVLNEYVNDQWITDYNNGFLDTSGTNDEITTYEFIGRYDATPDSVAGLFKAS